MKKLLLIDSDGLCYHALRETVEESIQILNEKIQNMFEKTEATHYAMFVSKGRYFRHNLFPEYKISREKYRNNSSSKWVKVLKEYLITQWNASWMDMCEADDLVTYWNNHTIWYNPEYTITEPLEITCRNSITPYNTENNPNSCLMEKIICSPDKDLLQSIAGKHFNYSYKLEDKNDPNSVVKGWWVETDIVDASFFELEQMVVGDVADGIKGLPGKGEAYVKKLLKDGVSLREFEKIVFAEYLNEYGDLAKAIYEFQKNYRLLHMLNCDEDFMREIGKLPQFPEIRSVNKQSVEQQIIPEF